MTRINGADLPIQCYYAHFVLGNGSVKGVKSMEQTGDDKNTTWLKQAWAFLLKYWQTLLDAWDATFHRTGTQIIMGIAGAGAVSYLVYSGSDSQPALYLLLVILTFLALAVTPAPENSYQVPRPPIKTRWKVFLGIAFVLPLYLMCLHEDFWGIHWRFINLNVLTVPILLFFRQAWNETWGDNRWLIMPAALIALWWINSSWIVTYETSQQWEVQEIYPLPLQNDSLRVSFPRQIPFAASEMPTLKIWCDNNINKDCGGRRVTLQSADKSLLFSYTTEPRIWQSQLLVRLNSSGTEQTILLARNPSEPNGQISLLAHDNGEINSLGKITFETESEAQARNFWLTLLQGGSVAVTLIGALYAGLKQWDEQKKKEEKELQKELLNKLRSVDNNNYRQIIQIIDEIYEKLDIIAAWQQRSKKEIQITCEKWIKELDENGQSLAESWHKSELIADSQINDFRTRGLAILSLFAIEDSPLIGLAKKIEQTSPKYVLSNKSVCYPLEMYPFRNIFLERITNLLSEIQKEKIFVHEAGNLYANPFDDWNNPFAYGGQKDQFIDDFRMLELNKLCFPLSEIRFSHQKYFFLTSWDTQAAFYSFCAGFNLAHYRPIAKQTMFVSVLPESWRSGLSLTKYLFSCLAERWLEILVREPGVVDELLSSEQDRLASLLLWRYRTRAAIKHRMMATAQGKDDSLMRISTKFLTRLEENPITNLPTSGEGLLKWLSLRPSKTYQTMFICTDTSPANITDSDQATILRSITPDFEKGIEPAGIYLACFFKALVNEKRYTINITDKKVVEEWLNSRIASCSQEKNKPNTFGALFPNIKMYDFIAKAQGSPGLMVLLAHQLLEPYINGEKDPDKMGFIDSDTLLGQIHF